jgi:hypothetical protein
MSAGELVFHIILNIAILVLGFALAKEMHRRRGP